MRLIDADALMAEMKEYRTEQEKEQMYSGDRGICVTWNDAMFFIKNAPTIEPEPSQVAQDIATIIENEKDMRVIGERKRGEWIEDEVFPKVFDINGIETWASKMRCDRCGFITYAIEGHMGQYNFCPNCGADMRGE